MALSLRAWCRRKARLQPCPSARPGVQTEWAASRGTGCRAEGPAIRRPCPARSWAEAAPKCAEGGALSPKMKSAEGCPRIFVRGIVTEWRRRPAPNYQRSGFVRPLTRRPNSARFGGAKRAPQHIVSIVRGIFLEKFGLLLNTGPLAFFVFQPHIACSEVTCCWVLITRTPR